MVTKPFHEAIVDIINDCHYSVLLLDLADLVIRTKVPKNHSEIIRAFRVKGEIFNLGKDWIENIVSKLSEEEAEEKAKEKDKEIPTAQPEM